MMAEDPGPDRYELSFTTGGLFAREAALLAPLYLDHRDWEVVRDLAVAGNLLQTRTYSSGVRSVRETVKRMSVLTAGEVGVMAEATSSERGYLMWAAACRRYALIGEFAEEVLRERYLILASTVDYEDFDSFARSKALWHEELAELKPSTLQRLRSNVFKMLREAELLSEDGRIIPALPSQRVADLWSARSPNDGRFFPARQVGEQMVAL